MKKLRIICKKIIIYIVIFMIITSCFPQTTLGFTQDQVGNAIGDLARFITETYGASGKNIVGYRQLTSGMADGKGGYTKPYSPDSVGFDGNPSKYDRTSNPIWKPGYNEEFMYFDCTSFASGVYKYVTGYPDITWPYTTTSVGNGTSSLTPDAAALFDVIVFDSSNPFSESKLKNGDFMSYDGHGWIYIGKGQTADCGSHIGNINNYSMRPMNALRLKPEICAKIKNLNTAFSYAGTGFKGGIRGSGSGIAVDYSNFFFNGIPDGQYSLASRKSIFEVLIDAIKDLVNFLTGLIGYLFRGLIIGIISIFDRLINNTVQSLTDAPLSLQETGVSATSADDPYSMYRSITIEGLIFNNVDLFDINIFRVD